MTSKTARITRAVAASLFGALLILPIPVQAANLVLNGDFETGTFASWTLLDTSGQCIWVGNPGTNPIPCQPWAPYGSSGVAPHGGNWEAILGPYDNDSYLEQDLATVAGRAYTLTFWLANTPDVGPGPNRFHASWGTREIYAGENLPYFGWSRYELSGLIAAGNTTTLTFGPFRNQPSFFELDDVSVTASPEPATLLLIGTSLLAAFGLLKKSL